MTKTRDLAAVDIGVTVQGLIEDNGLSGNKVDGGTISNFASTGIDDNATSTAMRIDSAGRVTMPYQPSFDAYLPVGGSKSTVLVYASTRHNTGNHYNTSTGLFTAPVTGVYHFTVSALFVYESPFYHRLAWYVNGIEDTRYGDTLENQAGASYSSANMSITTRLIANDTIGVYTSGAGTYGSSYGAFSGYLLG